MFPSGGDDRRQNDSWPRLRKMTKWGPAYTVQHTIYSNKARWVVRLPGGRLQYEHILIWEEATGRKHQRGWVIHHINGDPLDNGVENLEAMTHEAHQSLHLRGNMRSHTKFDGIESKQCLRCHKILPLREFGLNGKSAAGTVVYRPRCKPCENLRYKRRAQ